MAKRNKRLEAIRANPKTVRPGRLHTVLVSEGVSWRQLGTSHRVYASIGKARPRFPCHNVILF